MSYSLNEIETLSKRAARGAGLSWGIAEDAGKAVRWLQSHDLEGAQQLADLFIQKDDAECRLFAPVLLEGIWQAEGGVLCPLVTGAALNDCADRLKMGAIHMQNVAYPLLIVPFASMAARHLRCPVSVTWAKTIVTTDGSGIHVKDPDQQIQSVALSCVRCEVVPDPFCAFESPGSRGTVGQEEWRCLTRFSQRTFAPASEASRNLGAGAGASDNE